MAYALGRPVESHVGQVSDCAAGLPEREGMRDEGERSTVDAGTGRMHTPPQSGGVSGWNQAWNMIGSIKLKGITQWKLCMHQHLCSNYCIAN